MGIFQKFRNSHDHWEFKLHRQLMLEEFFVSTKTHSTWDFRLYTNLKCVHLHKEVLQGCSLLLIQAFSLSFDCIRLILSLFLLRNLYNFILIIDSHNCISISLHLLINILIFLNVLFDCLNQFFLFLELISFVQAMIIHINYIFFNIFKFFLLNEVSSIILNLICENRFIIRSNLFIFS